MKSRKSQFSQKIVFTTCRAVAPGEGGLPNKNLEKPIFSKNGGDTGQDFKHKRGGIER
jgi:hypothetical protein